VQKKEIGGLARVRRQVCTTGVGWGVIVEPWVIIKKAKVNIVQLGNFWRTHLAVILPTKARAPSRCAT